LSYLEPILHALWKTLERNLEEFGGAHVGIASSVRMRVQDLRLVTDCLDFP